MSSIFSKIKCFSPRFMNQISNSIESTGEKCRNPITFSQFTNGEKILSMKRRHNLSHIILDIKCGARFEDEKERGMAHLLRHTLLGTNKYQTIISNTRSFFQIGSDVSIENNRDSLTIRATIAERYFFNTFDFIAACISFNKFYYHEVQYALQSCLIDYDNLKSNLLIENVIDSLHFQLFRNSYGNSLYVRPDCTSTIREYNLKDYYNKYFLSDRITVGVISDYSHHFIEEIMSECLVLPGINTEMVQSTEITPNKIFINSFNGEEVINCENRYYHTALGYIAPSFHCESWATFYILQKIFGGNNNIITSLSSSSHFKKMFEMNNYQLSSFYIPYDNVGIFGFYFIASRDEYNKSVQECFQSLGDLLTNDITDSEINRAIAIAKLDFYQTVDTPLKLMSESVSNASGSGKILDVSERIKAIESVTINDIKSVIEKICKTRPTMVSLGNASYIPPLDYIFSLIQKN